MRVKQILLILLFAATVPTGVWLLRASGASWDALETASAVFVNLTILFGAAAAIMKFQLYNLLGHRWRSDLTCKHYNLPDGSLVFTADYSITNTGERPLRLTKVRVRLLPAICEGVLLKPDSDHCIAERIMSPTDSTLKGLFQIEPSERSIFTLRCKLPQLKDVVFIQCGFESPDHRVPAAFSGIYVKSQDAHVGRQPNVGSSSDPLSAIPAP